MTRFTNIDMHEQVEYSSALLAAGTPMYVFDVETTGLKFDTDRILSFSAFKIIQNGGIGQIDDKINIFINPGFEIPQRATKLNGITNEMVCDAPLEEEAAKQIRDFLGERPFLVGYNSVHFDEKMLNSMYLRVFGETIDPLFHLDIMLMAKEKLGLASYKLSEVAKALGVNQGLTFHRSMDDVIATYRVYDVLRIEYEYPDIPFGTMDVKIRDAKYWEGPRWNLRRIYVTAYPPHKEDKIYYDIAKKEWVSDNDEINLTNLRNSVLEKYAVKDERALVNALK